MVIIYLIFVNAADVKTATCHTIVLKACITLRGTRPSTAQSFPNTWTNVSMGTIVASHIVPKSLKLDLSTRWHATMTFICSTLKQSGVRLIRTITKHSVYMLITGKTSEESQICLSTILRSAQLGSRAPSLPSITKAARECAVVLTAKVGKN